MLSVAELRECGLSDDAIRTRVRRGNLHPLDRGVYAVGHRNVTTEGRFLAAVKACGPESVLSRYCAACHRGWLKYDGRPCVEWHSDPLAQRDDLDREADLEAAGERVLRTTKAQVMRDPARFLARLRAAGAPTRSD